MKNKTTPRDRMLNKAREYTIGTYVSRFVAKEFQRLIRAEAAAQPSGYTDAIVNGHLDSVFRPRGMCACVTCGVVKPWHGAGMHTGHFLASRRLSILFVEDNVAPQCNGCNTFRGGMPEQYHLWMAHVHGPDVINRLRALKATTQHFSRDELVDLRIAYKLRMKEAKRILKDNA